MPDGVQEPEQAAPARRRDRAASSTMFAVGLAAAGLALVVIRVPGGLSGAERLGIWAALAGGFGLVAFLKSRQWD